MPEADQPQSSLTLNAGEFHDSEGRVARVEVHVGKASVLVRGGPHEGDAYVIEAGESQEINPPAPCSISGSHSRLLVTRGD